jgi:hypothetical protein
MKRGEAGGEHKSKVARPKVKREQQALTIPTSAQIKAAVDDLGLEEGPAAVLDFVIKDALADLWSYQGWRKRKLGQDEWIAEPIEEIHRLLTKLVSFLETNPGVLKEILPAPAGEKLGALFSFTGIGRALDRDAFPDDGNLLASYLEREAQQFDVASVEKFYTWTRENIGLIQGDRLFLYALRVVLEPLEGWVEAKAANKGGRPAYVERRHLIQRLATAAPMILGSEPPTSVGSRFVELCERVLPLCGFAEEGIDKAVVSVLSAMRSKARSSSDSGNSTQ